MSQISGAFTVEVQLDRFAERVAERVATILAERGWPAITIPSEIVPPDPAGARQLGSSGDLPDTNGVQVEAAELVGKVG
jgi:hypothetical protein